MKKSLDWTEAKLKLLWEKAEDASYNDDKSLAILRILYGLFIIFFATPSYSWIAEVPQSLFVPPYLSLANAFNSFPDRSWLLAIDILLVICAIALLMGIKARYAGIIFSLFYIIGSSFEYSFGKIDHFILFPVFILGLSFTNWGAYNALIPDKRVDDRLQRRILAVLAVILCFAMLTAGAMKALLWLDLDLRTGGFLSWYYEGFFTFQRQGLLAPFVTLVPSGAFELFDYFAVAFELSPFIALLAGRKWWQLWLFVASIFHLGNLMLLNIAFIEHSVIYLSFVPLASLVNLRPIHWKKKYINLFVSTITAVIVIHHLFYFFTSTSNSIGSVVLYALPLAGSEVKLSLYAGLLIWFLTVYITGVVTIKAFNNVSIPKLSR